MSQHLEFKDTEGSSYVKGSRRRRLGEYLKAANELRQSYQQAYGLGGQHDGEVEENGSRTPGAQSDAALVRVDDEELVLFPSYARQHQTRKRRHLEPPGATQDLRSGEDSGNTEYWRKQWAMYEDDNSIVDVDVRGWIYAPHRGAMTRKNRVLLGLARHLSGVPAPTGGNSGAISAETLSSRHDEELVEKEAESILNRGEVEADLAQQGKYSEQPSSKTTSPRRGSEQHTLLHRPSATSLRGGEGIAPGSGGITKRASWNQPSEMTPTELAVANAHLMARLKPFLTNPLVSIPVTIFFFNDETSKSRTINTDDSGHFSLRAALGFVPTHVRVLASDRLSTTVEVRITEPTGVSMISDIDDTIKHSGIGSGAKEIFRNIFIRDLGDLTIEGVKEWYSKMADLGVKLHYVSNSPWQLYPLLVSFFAKAGLPQGSFHLKQYSGMLQGIFEPVAERKKGTLERIIQDFPKRRFILVGDSGEADLELYTELLLANPGRILGVFIRDVTTTKPQGFFDSSIGKMSSQSGSQSSVAAGQSDDKSNPAKKSLHVDEKRPSLPPRQRTRSTSGLNSASNGKAGSADESSRPSRGLHRSMTESTVSTTSSKSSLARSKIPPLRPLKPLALRGKPDGPGSATPPIPPSMNLGNKPPPPPNPRKFSTSRERLHPGEHNTSPSRNQRKTPSNGTRGGTSAEPQGYRSAVINKITSTYNNLPTWSSPLSAQPEQPPSSPSPSPSRDGENPPKLPSRPPKPTPPKTPSTSTTSSSSTSNPAPPIPARRNLSSYPAAAAHYASNRLSSWSGYSSDGGGGGGGGGSSDDINGGGSSSTNSSVNKKEEIWNRRWARAKEIFESKGVMLKTWRVGEDVLEDAVALVEKASREEDSGGKGKGGKES